MSQSRTIEITVNGEARSWSGDSVLELLRDCQLDIGRPGFAVALNAAVLPRAKWADTALADGDRIEIVGMYKGG